MAIARLHNMALRKDFAISDFCHLSFVRFTFSVYLNNLQENLVESKHHKLARSLRSGPSDHDLKPNAATRDQLNVRNFTDCIKAAKWAFYYSPYYT